MDDRLRNRLPARPATTIAPSHALTSIPEENPLSDDPHCETVETNGITLNVARAGPTGGPLVILLHGFPEFWWGWRHQIGPLAGAGHRVLAPDQRGYNLSAKPKGIVAYRLDALADDAIGLIDAEGRDRATLIGHDWGGIVAWWAALRHPDRVERAAILNAPHPASMSGRLLRDPAQLLRSWYIAAFQMPGLPETLLGLGRGRPLARSLRTTSRPGTFPEADLDEYRRAWSQPGALRAMVDWYRAGIRARPPIPADPTIEVPVRILWGARDAFLGIGLAHAALELCRNGRLDILDDASHWLHHEEPDRVNQILLEFLDEPPQPGRASSVSQRT